jgi:hypothetical protein
VDLAGLQTRLLGMVKGRYRPEASEDPYIRRLAGSTHLSLVREIAGWWRGVAIETNCPLTTAVLRRPGVFDEAVRRFTSRPDVSPFYEQQAGLFLEEMSRHDDPLIASVASFERAVLDVRVFGQGGRQVVEWEHDPYAVLASLTLGTPLDEERCRGRYRTVISPDLPGIFRVEEMVQP